MTDPDRSPAAERAPHPADADATDWEDDAASAPVATAHAKPPTDWWGEIKAIFWLILAVLAFHSFVAKPFYIPSESMMPGLLKGDRLVVSKYAYGWSWVSPSFHILPEMRGRLWGRMPQRGDVVIVTPPGVRQDYIKRVIGLPGDTVEMVDGRLYLNGEALRREERGFTDFALDPNLNCRTDTFGDYRAPGEDGRRYCRMPVVREYLPDGRWYDTIDLGDSTGDDFGPVQVPEGHVFLMGDNRDQSADSRFPLGEPENGLGGPVPWENIGGRAEFITFSLDGSSSYWNPISWFTALRGGRAGTSLRPGRAEPAPEAAR